MPQRCALTSTTAVLANARNPITGSWTRNEIAFVAARITRARARLPTRFLGTMNRISSVFRRNSSPAVMTPTLMACVISRYRINFPSENFRSWITYRFENDVITLYEKSIWRNWNVPRYLSKKKQYQVWPESSYSRIIWWICLKLLFIT